MSTVTQFIKCMGMLVLMFTFQSLMAQPSFHIVAPASIAGEYEVGIGSFGSKALTPVSGELALGTPNEGCTAFTNPGDLAGKIVMIDRGTCAFVTKAQSCADAGAIGMIVCNNVDGLQGMSGDGSFDFPCMMLTTNDCNSIKAQLAAGSVVGQFSFAGLGQDVVLWGEAAGDNGDFSDGLNGWENVGITDAAMVWEFGTDTTVMSTCRSEQLLSPTSENGIAYFDGDGYINAGSDPCSQATSRIDAELISPVIDCTNFGEVAISFWQYNLPIGEDEGGTFISWSFDGGTTWQTPEPVPSESYAFVDGSGVSHANAANPEKLIFYVPGAADSENFRFKFIHNRERGYYFWAIDDVTLIQPPNNDVVVENGFYAPLSAQTPIKHMPYDTFGFSVNLQNKGSKVQNPLAIYASIEDAAGNVMYIDSMDVSMDPASRDTFSFDGVSLTLDEGEYNIVYRAQTRDSVDAEPDDNEISFPFTVTNELFAKELATSTTGLGAVIRSTANTDPWFYGAFYTINNIDPSEDPFMLKEIYLAMGAADDLMDSEEADIYIMKWEDDNDQYPQFTGELNMAGVSPLTHPNMTAVAGGTINSDVYGSAANGEMFTMPIKGNFLDLQTTQPIDSDLPLEQGATYLIMVQLPADNSFGLASQDAQDLPGVPGILQNWNGTGEYFSGFSSSSPVVRALVTQISASTDVELTEAQAKLYPNITSDVATLALNFEEAANGFYTITDAKGAVVKLTDFNDVTSREDIINVETMISGNYFVNIYSNAGRKQLKMTVVK